MEIGNWSWHCFQRTGIKRRCSLTQIELNWCFDSSELLLLLPHLLCMSRVEGGYFMSPLCMHTTRPLWVYSPRAQNQPAPRKLLTPQGSASTPVLTARHVVYLMPSRHSPLTQSLLYYSLIYNPFRLTQFFPHWGTECWSRGPGCPVGVVVGAVIE